METILHYEGTQTKAIVKNPNEHIQRHWVENRFYETQRNGLLNVIYQREKIGGVFIDIGASIGNHSLFFANVMRGKVIAFEPHIDSFRHLEENMALNADNIDWALLKNCALGDREGTVSMKSNSPDNVGMFQVDEKTKGNVDLAPLDKFYVLTEGYDVIKIDVEHYNRPLLTGAKLTLTNGRGNVYIEAETAEILAETDEIMKEYGYSREEGLIMNHTPTYLYKKV